MLLTHTLSCVLLSNWDFFNNHGCTHNLVFIVSISAIKTQNAIYKLSSTILGLDCTGVPLDATNKLKSNHFTTWIVVSGIQLVSFCISAFLFFTYPHPAWLTAKAHPWYAYIMWAKQRRIDCCKHNYIFSRTSHLIFLTGLHTYAKPTLP